MLPGNHLVRAQPMSATDYKPLTATLDPFFRILRSNLFIYVLYPAHILPVKCVSGSRFVIALAYGLYLGGIFPRCGEDFPRSVFW